MTKPTGRPRGRPRKHPLPGTVTVGPPVAPAPVPAPPPLRAHQAPASAIPRTGAGLGGQPNSYLAVLAAGAGAGANRQPAPLLQHKVAQRLLDELTLRYLTLSGSTNKFVAAATLNASLLRALDTNAPETPEWLRAAAARAQSELAAWYIARGLPGPECGEEDDPGDPTPEQVTRAATFPFTRPQSDDEKVIEWLKCRRSVVYFIDNYCSLADKERGVIPFRLWPWQAWLLWQWRAHAKNVVLKSRQIGASECAGGFAYHLIRFNDTKLALLISRGEDEAIELLGRARVMEASLPRWLHPGVGDTPNPDAVDACVVAKANTKLTEYVHFDADGNPRPSRIESLPATPGTGRSRTASLVVLDEWAHMQWGDDIWGGVKATAEGRGGVVIGISTAKGMGNAFHRIYMGGAEKINGFFAAFLSWQRHPERDAAWYVRQRAEHEADGHVEYLHQEYPSEAIEAFIQSGRPVFSQDYLMRHQQRIREEITQRAALELPPWREVDGLTLYEDPVPGYEYILGADVAEGKEGGDFSDASIICRQTGREVAALHGLWPVDVYAARLDEVGYLYNRALLAVERNQQGGSVILALMSGLAHEQWAPEHTRVAYPNLYHYTSDLVPGQRQDRRPGWLTDMRTKPMAVNSLARALREDAFLPRSERFLQEATYFSWDETGAHCGAPSGFHDDTVASRWIAVHLLLQPDQIAQAVANMRALKDLVERRVAAASVSGDTRPPTGAPARVRPALALATLTAGAPSPSSAASTDADDVATEVPAAS